MGTDTEKSSGNRVIKKYIRFLLLLLPLLLIKTYRYFISPLLGNQCRFYPTCSHYSEEAFQRFGLLKGTWLTINRLLKCHPWHEGGIDNVPDLKTVVKKDDIKTHNCN